MQPVKAQAQRVKRKSDQAKPLRSRSGRARATAEKLPYLTEESGGFRVGILGRELLEFVEQLALTLGEFLRRLDHDLDIHVARLLGAQHRHALAVQAEAAA